MNSFEGVEWPTLPLQVCVNTNIGDAATEVSRAQTGPGKLADALIRLGIQECFEQSADPDELVADLADGNVAITVLSGRPTQRTAPPSYTGVTHAASLEVVPGDGMWDLRLSYEDPKGYSAMRFLRRSTNGPWLPLEVLQGLGGRGAVEVTHAFTGRNVPVIGEFSASRIKRVPLIRVAGKLGLAADSDFLAPGTESPNEPQTKRIIISSAHLPAGP